MPRDYGPQSECIGIRPQPRCLTALQTRPTHPTVPCTSVLGPFSPVPPGPPAAPEASSWVGIRPVPGTSLGLLQGGPAPPRSMTTWLLSHAT